MCVDSSIWTYWVLIAHTYIAIDSIPYIADIYEYKLSSLPDSQAVLPPPEVRDSKEQILVLLISM